MKISDLVTAQHALKSLTTSSVNTSLVEFNREVDLAKNQFVSDDLGLFANISSKFESLTTIIKDIETLLSSAKDALAQQVAIASEPYCRRGSIIDGVSVVDTTTPEIDRMDRNITYIDDINVELAAKISKYTWPVYPALEIGPGDGQWTKHMISSDPLYLVDRHQEFLDSTASKYPVEYQRRLRRYQVGAEGVGEFDYSRLPQDQFGFILAMHVLDFYTLDVISIIINQCFSLLRPGGVLMFTYNNTELPNCAALAEKGFKGWAPKNSVIEICTQAGLVLIASTEGIINCLEVRKPGELKTTKINQALGEIIFAHEL